MSEKSKKFQVTSDRKESESIRGLNSCSLPLVTCHFRPEGGL